MPVQMRTILEVADNSGAKRLACILPLGGSTGLKAGLGDIITASVKEASPDSNVKKGAVVKCVIVRTRKETRRKDGTYLDVEVSVGLPENPKGGSVVLIRDTTQRRQELIAQRTSQRQLEFLVDLFKVADPSE